MNDTLIQVVINSTVNPPRVVVKAMVGDPATAIRRVQEWTQALGIENPSIVFDSDTEQHRHVYEDKSRVQHRA